jgi:hypothetical protein
MLLLSDGPGVLNVLPIAPAVAIADRSISVTLRLVSVSEVTVI